MFPARSIAAPKTTFAVDTGGTFTDLIVSSGGQMRMFKAPTTPDDPVEGVLDALAVAADAGGVELSELLAGGTRFIHGTTRALNALVTGNAARTAFLTTVGHPDVLLFREGGRANPFDFSVAYPQPLVPRSLTVEVEERIAADGSIVEPLDEAALLASLAALAGRGVEAIGVSLLWSIVNPRHEIRVGELISEQLPEVRFTLSHQLNPTLREYRRASATCIDASLKPLMGDYLDSLEGRLREAGFRGRVLIVTSQGGMLDARQVAAAPIHSINSGPAMAPVAGRHYAEEESSCSTAIIADTGGTTFDVSVVRDGVIPRTRETWLGPAHQGHITGFPSVDIKSVGAGGGSIAWVDEGGLLRVGPQSAGSVPGPAAYGRGGTEPTLTDACLLLGYLDPDYFLGGAMRLDLELASAALERIAEPLGMSLEATAAAVLEITTENMVHAIEEITVSQGIDPTEAVLIGGGGAAGLNMNAIAARLGCREVLLPDTGAALSAAGALLSEVGTDFSRTYVTRSDAFDFEGANAVLDELRRECVQFAAAGSRDVAPRIDFAIEARYPSQNWEIESPLGADSISGPADVEALCGSFHHTYEQLFAIAEPSSPIEIVGWRARVRIANESGRPSLLRAGERPRTAGSRPVYVPGLGWTEVGVFELDAVVAGEVVPGPAVVETPFTTIVVEAGSEARKTDRGALLIKRGTE